VQRLALLLVKVHKTQGAVIEATNQELRACQALYDSRVATSRLRLKDLCDGQLTAAFLGRMSDQSVRNEELYDAVHLVVSEHRARQEQALGVCVVCKLFDRANDATFCLELQLSPHRIYHLI